MKQSKRGKARPRKLHLSFASQVYLFDFGPLFWDLISAAKISSSPPHLIISLSSSP
jgi:hypothetical protein